MLLPLILVVVVLLLIFGYTKHRQINGWADKLPGHQEWPWEWAVVRTIGASRTSKYDEEKKIWQTQLNFFFFINFRAR